MKAFGWRAVSVSKEAGIGPPSWPQRSHEKAHYANEHLKSQYLEGGERWIPEHTGLSV